MLNTLLMVFEATEWIREKIFKTFYKGKDWQRTHYTTKAKKGNAHKADGEQVLETQRVVLPSRLFILTICS
jgi:hypothetical protein